MAELEASISEGPEEEAPAAEPTELGLLLLELRAQLHELEASISEGPEEEAPAAEPTELGLLPELPPAPHFLAVRGMGLKCRRCGVVIGRDEPEADQTVTAHLAICS
jgi:hypothetical protein